MLEEDNVEQVRSLLSKKRSNLFAVLLDLTTLLPAKLLSRAISLAEHANDKVLQAFLVNKLAARLPDSYDRSKLTKRYPLPAGMSIRKVSIPEGKRVKRMIAELSEKERYQFFEQLLVSIEAQPLQPTRSRPTSEKVSRSRKRRSGASPATKSADFELGDVERMEPADSEDGSITWTELPFIGPVDDEEFELAEGELDEGGESGFPAGFESAGGAESEDAEGGGAAFEDDDGFESVTPAPQPQPASSATSDETPERTDIVNLGFAHSDAADHTLKSDEPLQTAHQYFFWLNVGRKHKDAIGEAVPLNVEELPAEAVLTVALFDFENELAITPGQDVGELKIQKDGSVRVLRQPIDPKSVPLSPEAAKDYLEHFLLFPISVPVKAAIHRLRCNIYCAQVLVQSHVVSANVKATPDPIPEACTKKLDYVLSENLRARHLVAMTEEPHLLSLMINDNGDGSHSFRFFGDDGSERFKDNAQIDGPEISGFLNEARQAMHKVSWGNVDPWDPAKPLAYRYQAGAFDRKKLARDLAFLARAGWAIFDGFASHLHTTIEDLQTLMATPGLVQIALKLSPRVVVPAAVIYDYNWAPDTYDFSTTEFQLCPTFSAAIDQARNGGPALEECDCFKGKCALKEMIAEITQDPDKTLADLPPMVCPSGFWGYRHSMGLPLTLDGSNKEVPPVIEFKNDLQMVAGVSTDPQFVLRDPHLTRLKALKSVLQFERNESYKAIVKRLKSAAPHLIYFYCHGGIRANNKRPYLEIGVDDRFGPESLSAEKIKWSEPHPLVFINGCHTTSLNPEISLHFVSSFVQQSGAAGVIGTEITIFEPLAAQFAEQCLSRFLGASPYTESMPIGKAVRGARLEILKQGNPLGLVYIPYAVATLRLQQAQQN